MGVSGFLYDFSEILAISMMAPPVGAPPSQFLLPHSYILHSFLRGPHAKESARVMTLFPGQRLNARQYSGYSECLSPSITPFRATRWTRFMATEELGRVFTLHSRLCIPVGRHRREAEALSKLLADELMRNDKQFAARSRLNLD